MGPKQKRGRSLSSRVPDLPGRPYHRRTQGIPTVLARLLRSVLRRPDQRNPLGAGVAPESSHPPPNVVLLSRTSRKSQEPARSSEYGARPHVAGDAKPAAPTIAVTAQSSCQIPKQFGNKVAGRGSVR